MNKYYIIDDFFKQIYQLYDELKEMEKEIDERQDHRQQRGGACRA